MRRRWIARLIACEAVVAAFIIGACVGDPPRTPDGAATSDSAQSDGGGSPNPEAAADSLPADPCDDDLCDLVATDLPRRVAVDDTHIYWATTESVARADKTKKGAAVDTIATNVMAPVGLVLTPSFLFWLTGPSCPEIQRWALNTRTTTRAPSLIGLPSRATFARDKAGVGTLFYSGSRWPSACANADAAVPAGDGGVIGGGVAIINEDLSNSRFFSEYGPTHACTTMDTNALASRPTPDGIDFAFAHAGIGELCWQLNGFNGLQQDSWDTIRALAITPDAVYWASKQGVHRQTRADGGLDEAATPIAIVKDAVGLVHDEKRNRLFLITETGALHSIEGSTATVLRETGCTATDLAQDDEFLYFPCQSQNTIKRMRKPPL